MCVMCGSTKQRKPKNCEPQSVKTEWIAPVFNNVYNTGGNAIPDITAAAAVFHVDAKKRLRIAVYIYAAKLLF